MAGNEKNLDEKSKFWGRSVPRKHHLPNDYELYKIRSLQSQFKFEIYFKQTQHALTIKIQKINLFNELLNIIFDLRISIRFKFCFFLPEQGCKSQA